VEGRSTGSSKRGQAISRSGSQPLYRQIETILRAELGKPGVPGGQTFTEYGLARRFDVSRYTIRQALAELTRAGLIERQRRRGTVPTTAPLIQQPLEGLYSFGRSLTALGLTLQSQVVSLSSILPTNDLLRQLELESDREPMVELVRLRSAGGEPLVIETIWLPEVLVPGIRHVDLTGSVYDALRDLYGLEMDSAQESIRPVVVDARQARALAVVKGAPAFFVERVTYSQERPVEVRHSLIRGDRYLYSVRLQAGAAMPAAS
jgi:GntR family transcriptional regulator